MQEAAASHGWSLDGISVVELSTFRGEDQEETLLHPAEFELGETTGRILEPIEQQKPDRLIIDNLSELRMLAHTPLRYRWQFFALRRLLTRLGCVVLMLDDKTARPDDLQVQTLVHGVIALERGNSARHKDDLIRARPEFGAGVGEKILEPAVVADEAGERRPRNRLRRSEDRRLYASSVRAAAGSPAVRRGRDRGGMRGAS